MKQSSHRHSTVLPGRYALGLLAALLWCLNAAAQAGNSGLLPGDSTVVVLPDSSNFVTASVVVATPGSSVYSVFGHCALRMQCPAHHLDYVYSLNIKPSPMSYLRYFGGHDQAAMQAVPTDAYLADYRGEGRGVTQHDLNLTHHEKQRLWQLLDEAMGRGPVYEFNLISTNCVQMTMVMIERALIDEQFDAGRLPEQFSWNNGTLLRHHARKSPWAEFAFITFAGDAAGGTEVLERKLSPETIVPVLQGATLVSRDGYRRPVLAGAPRQLVPLTLADTPSPLTPIIVFAALLAVVALVTLLEWRPGWRVPARVADIILLAAQTTIGLVLAYTTFISGLLGAQWNWYLIPFCPLAVVLWLALRKRQAISQVYLLFTAVLLLFLLITPLVPQLDLPHQLVTATLATRTAGNYLITKKI